MTDDTKAAGIAMRLIEQVDPPQTATVEIAGDVDAEAIEGMSLSQLLTFAQAHGIEVPDRVSPPEPVDAPGD